MSGKSFNPQEVIIRELLEKSSSDCLYDLSTLQFLKMHTSGEYQLHHIACQTTTGEQHDYLFVLRQWENEGWDCEAIWSWPAADSLEQTRLDDSPRVALGSFQTFGPLVGSQFLAFGSVHSQEVSITSVRLRSSDNILLEDVVKQGLVLFVSNKVIVPPVWAELYDETGRCVNQYQM